MAYYYKAPAAGNASAPAQHPQLVVLTVEDVKNIKAAMLVQHGGNDKRLVEGWPAYDAALTAANVKHEGFIYPNAEHGFNNDTTPRYDAASAKLAWDRTIAHFNKYLR